MIAGICEIQYVDRKDVETFPFRDELAPDSIALSDIVLKSGKTWKTWAIDAGSGEFKQEPVNRNGNNYFRQRITWKASGVALPEKEKYKDCNCMHIVKLTDANGITHLVGSVENPAQFNLTIQIDKKKTGENSYSCQYYRDSMWHTVIVNAE